MALEGKRVLVTGATGFLGGHAIERLRERRAVPLAHGRDAAKLARLEELGFETHTADLGEDGAAARLVEASAPDLVLHAAALSAPYGPKRAFVRANTVGTASLARAAAAADVRGMVFVSTPSLYCAGAPLVNVREDAPLPRRSINHYAASKRAAEDDLREFAATADLPFVILRPRAIYGPGDTALFPRLVRALGQRRLPILGDGSARIDLTYVDDACLAGELALEQLASGAGPALGNTYNVTGGERVALWPLIEDLAQRLGLPPSSRRVPRAVARPLAAALEFVHTALRRPGEPVLTRYSVDALSLNATLDISAARRDLGYAPEVAVDEGIARFLASLEGAR